MLNGIVRITIALYSIFDEFASSTNEVDTREGELLMRYVDLVIANEIVNCLDFESMFIGVCSPFKTILSNLLGEENNI